MCGIFGIYFFDPRYRVAESILKQMGETVINRGPDDQGYYIDNNVGMGIRRLAIIDVKGGKQPAANEKKNIHAVLNGELYNYLELKKNLLMDSHSFRSNSDTEVIPHLYENFGEGFVEKLNGMFAVSLWDRNRQKLLLYRDRLGIKPLYYYMDQEKLIWGSELKSILATGLVEREIMFEAVKLFFQYGYVPAPYSIFKKIKKLNPGQFLKIENNKVKFQSYWQLNVKPFNGRYKEAEERLSHLLLQSVKYRLISDVPLGAFLSGGLDSSLVVGLMSQTMNQPVQTFSIKFSEKTFDESSFAKKAANHLNTAHHQLEVRPDPIDILEKILPYFDEPFADQSVVPAFYVSKMAREYVTVALSGDGGDELFAGYKKYRTLKSADIYSRFKPFSTVLFRCGMKISGKIGRRFGNSVLYGEMKPGARFASQAGVLSDADVLELLSPRVLEEINPETDPIKQKVIQVTFDNMRPGEEMNRWLQLDVETYLVDDVLTKVDRMSMFHSLEVRVPFLDHHVVEFAQSLPANFKLKFFKGKFVLKKIAERIIPGEIVYRNKHAWMVPVGTWLRNELKDAFWEMITGKNSDLSDILNLSKIQEFAAKHFNGKMNRSTILWNILTFMVWFNRWAN